MQKFNKSKSLIGLLFAIAIILLTPTATSAFAGAGRKPSGGSCYANSGKTTNYYWDTCYGATWQLYKVTKDPYEIPGKGNVPGATMEGCAKYGYYYRLGLAVFKTPNGPSTGEQAGVVANSTLNAPDLGLHGNTRYRVKDSEEPLSIIKQHYDLMTAHGENRTVRGEVIPWEDAGWFCWDPDFEKEEGGGTFQAKTTIDIVNPNNSNNAPSNLGTLTSNWNGKVYAAFSIDDSVDVKFTHIMRYGNKTVDWEEHGHGHDIVYSPTNNWTVSDDGSTLDGVGGDGSGSYVPNARIPMKDFTSDSTQYTKTAHINISSIAPGETKLVCSKITFGNTAEFDGEYTGPETSERNGKIVETHEGYYTWTPTMAKTRKTSKACVEITRPKDPEGNVWTGNNNILTAGTVAVQPMYAGEDSRVGYSVKATNYNTRRLAQYRSVVFAYNPNLGFNQSLVSGNPRSSSDPCGHYGSQNAQYCTTFNGTDRTIAPATYANGEEITPSDEEGVVVPNQVGAKYCSSFGFKFEYYYATAQRSRSDYTWHPANRSYWYNFNASCRTIAKKPSTAAWNGSVMSTAPILTSLSPRYNNTEISQTLGVLTKNRDSKDKTLYGSWSEYLAIGGQMEPNHTIASGSTLSKGSSISKLCNNSGSPWSTNSPLTIANVDCILGDSGISANSSFQTRLEAYLKNQATPLGDQLGALENVRSTQIYRANNLKINGNITLANDAYTPHSLPQVIIFVDGNLEISDQVSQIDAWLIVGGDLKTCQNFQTPSSGNLGTSADSGSNRNACGGQLIFNGPVIVKNQLDLRRSFGADPSVTRTGTFGDPSSEWAPAEIFNLRADTYLWAYAQAARYNSSYSEVYSRELAPRY